jgi:acetyltransferase-like isoleucine patch superfamily enzyme
MSFVNSTYGKYTYGRPTYTVSDKLYGIPTYTEQANYTERAKCVVGNFCVILNNVNIYLGVNHKSNLVTTYPFGYINNHRFNTFNGGGHPSTKGYVIIGNDVWIGNNVTIISGITIGDGAVIESNSHVVKNIDPYSIVGGNPAKLIKYRFTPEQITKLLEIKWWDWDDDKINKFIPLLCNDNIDTFITSAAV